MRTYKESPSYLNFNQEEYQWKPHINYREQPELYRVGKGEQGVLICEPYKSEIGRFWRFRTKAIAEESSSKIYAMFLDYLKDDDFIGADMARKYLQMGFTRARRYANYKGGVKYDKTDDYQPLQKGTGQKEKAEAATVYYQMWRQAEANSVYANMKQDWKSRIG